MDFGRNMSENTDELKFSLKVYEDYAIIRGKLTAETLTLLINLCNEYEFKYITPHNGGFKLIK